MDLVRDTGIQLRQSAPVRAGMLVVRRVKTVIEDEEISESRDEVAGVVMPRPWIAVNVLNEIDEHHSPEPRSHRDAERPHVQEQPQTPPVESHCSRQERGVRGAKRQRLKPDTLVQSRRGRPHLPDVGSDERALPVGGDEEIRRSDQPGVLLRVPPGDRRVPIPVQVLVVVQVVSRYPGEDGMPVEHRQPRGEDAVGRAAIEDRAVVVVVRENARAEADVEDDREHPYEQARARERR